jgi:hypothetical protein
VSFFEKRVPVIKPKQIPKAITPFKVFEEADRMNPVAREWYNDFTNGEKLMKSSDTSTLRKAYELFTRSVMSFPDSYLAQKAHLYRAGLLKKLNKSSDAAMEKKRAQEFYINLD